MMRGLESQAGEKVYYWVIGAEGQRYGPADIDTLVAWAGEHRLNASTVLIERGTERQITAESLTAVAAAIRRASPGGEAVTIERDIPGSGDAATITRRHMPDGAPSPFNAQPGMPSSPAVPAAAPPPLPPFPVGTPPAYQPVLTPYVVPPQTRGPKNKIVAGLLGIFLGGLGIHRFYLGYTGIGLLMLILGIGGGVTSFACLPGVGCGLIWLWGFVEGIICLCGGMRDAEGRELSS
jgi:TM2 domain-containing membrane protein YozV